MTKHNESTRRSAAPTEQQITLRSAAELADALPYLVGFHPDDSVVMAALHGERGRLGGRLRLGIPRTREEWPDVCDQLAETLVTNCEKRGSRPDGIVLFFCQDPAPGESGRAVMERLRPFAQRLRIACGGFEVPVYEALCISDGRFWSYCCPDSRCCPEEGVPMALPGTSAMAAAATYAGMRVRGTLKEMEARLAPMTGTSVPEQERALDAAAGRLVPRVLDGDGCGAVREETMDALRLVLGRFRDTPPLGHSSKSDAHDDALLSPEEAATIIIGLQDRTTRDQAAEWMEGPDGQAALRLWRVLARRCVGSYTEYGAAPLALAGWVAWSIGEGPEARVAFSRALRIDPDYLFAHLLFQACNDGLDPETLRNCLRRERADRAVHAAAHAELERAATTDGASANGRRRRPRSKCGPVTGTRTAPARTAAARTTGPARTTASGRPAGAARAAGSGGTTGPAGPTGPGKTSGSAGKSRARGKDGQRDGMRGTRSPQ
ncbi:DUF4192 domain-containing protein [Streptomyces sp. NPDC050617]|uniref:DUF4192 domain-containing protein n=1 Tax=Streptomyces sp. NPDC050617 TaxID=3154628 RepID=UPI00342D97B8